jgi:hypothetical protein
MTRWLLVGVVVVAQTASPIQSQVRPEGRGIEGDTPSGHLVRPALPPAGGGPSRALSDTLALHASRIAGLPVVPFSAAQVPGVVLTLNWEVIDYNVARARFVPLSVPELETIRAAMRGEWVRDLA